MCKKLRFGLRFMSFALDIINQLASKKKLGLKYCNFYKNMSRPLIHGEHVDDIVIMCIKFIRQIFRVDSKKFQQNSCFFQLRYIKNANSSKVSGCLFPTLASNSIQRFFSFGKHDKFVAKTIFSKKVMKHCGKSFVRIVNSTVLTSEIIRNTFMSWFKRDFVN